MIFHLNLTGYILIRPLIHVMWMFYCLSQGHQIICLLDAIFLCTYEERKNFHEFMINGETFFSFFPPSSPGRKGVKGAQPGPVLSWAQRVKIAVGAAKGLEYLHEKAEPHIIHRDIKSSNVLIFDDDVAKIADFDLSNQAPDMAARLHSTRVLGTFGYHAPE